MTDIYRIAIDGPSGAGKSTVAKTVAKVLGIEYIDTGAMYRAIGLKMVRLGIPFVEDEALLKMLEETDIDFAYGKVFLDGEDVSGLIRTNEISKAASDCSAFKSVRVKLVEIQQGLGKKKSIIMEGRDICTVVLTDAEFKYFLTASAEERARRRYKELVEKDPSADYDDILRQINERDYNDSHREVDPLRQAEDAILIDSSDMSIDEVVDFIVKRVEKYNG
ncbi:MAG: (d)CMP kinase [Clostridia bacterium]|nr:(d)CMP kinase [Clostridia bacterium]